MFRCLFEEFFEWRGQLIWLTISAIIVQFLIINFNLVTILLTLIWVSRIIFAGNRHIILPNILISLIIVTSFAIHQMDTKRQQAGFPQNAQLAIDADKYELKQNNLIFSGEINGINYSGIKPSLSDQEIKLIKNQDSNLILSADYVEEPMIGATNRFVFDFDNYLKRQLNIYHRLKITKISNYENSVNYLSISQWRRWIKDYLDNLPNPLGSLSKALLIGVKDENFSSMADIFIQLGIIHMFCLSGLHLNLLSKVNKKIFVLTKSTVEKQSIINISLLFLFYLIAGQVTSLRRALLWVMLCSMKKYLRWKISNQDCWSICVLICLIQNPYLFCELGGILSFLIPLILISLPKNLNIVKNQFAILLISEPIIIYFQYQLNLFTLPLNLIVGELFGILIIPVVIIGAISYKILPFITVGCNFILQKLNFAFEYLTFQSWSKIIIGQPPIIILLLMLLLAILINFSSKKRNRFMFIYGGIFLGLIFKPFLSPLGIVSMVDIGQGDSFIIKLPYSKSVSIIDTGGKLRFGNIKQTGKSIAVTNTINYLRGMGIDRVDRIFLSHQDMDHIGYLNDFIKNISVDEIVIANGMEQNEQFIKQIKSFTGKIKKVSAGDLIKIGGNEQLQVLGPSNLSNGKNEDSLILYGVIGSQSWLFTGDAPIAVEQDLLKRYLIKVDNLKVGHHGSKTSTDEELLKKYQVKNAFISAGRNNRYGHPNEETIKKLKENSVTIYNTQEVGMVEYVYNNLSRNFKIKTYKKVINGS